MPTALVTGASRGVGRGVAIALAANEFTVHATGRTVESAGLPTTVAPLRCDHTNAAETARVFEPLAAGGLDLLVNAAWGGYERMAENGEFTWPLPFWRQPAHRWTSMMEAGVHAAFMASAHAAPLMISRGGGLIVHLGYWAARKYLGNAIYGMAKSATDQMAAGMAHELRPHGVAVLSLYPGFVRMESVMEAARACWLGLSNRESPEFIGRVIAALFHDPGLMQRTGKVVVVRRRPWNGKWPASTAANWRP